MTKIKNRDQILLEWCHSPWHSWLKDEPAWLGLFAELWARMPEKAMQETAALGALVILPPVHCARVVRLELPANYASVLQLDGALLHRPREETLGILAHELAHLCVPATASELANDLAADALARKWGFGKELDAALRADLETGHPRLAACA